MNFRKLLPFILVAEGGLAAFQIGYCIAVFAGAESVFVLVGALSAVAAIVFTVLCAAKIKPRLTIVAALVCIALAVFIYLLTSAISGLNSVAYYKAQLAIESSEEVKAILLQNMHRNALLGCTALVFAVAVLPLSIYLPIWFLRRNTVSE